MQVRLLGPVDVLAEDGPRPVQGLRRKAVLAALALHAGEVVSTDTLVDVVWGEVAPATASNTLQSHVSYLRTVLGRRAAILARAPGYLLALGPDATDKLVAERLLREGTQATDPALAVRQLQPAAARVPGLPGAGDQPRPAHRPGRRRGRSLAAARPDDLSAGVRSADPPAGGGADGRGPGIGREIVRSCARLPLALAIVAARDVAGQAHSLNRLACGYARSGRITQADPLFRQSLRLFEDLGDHVSQAMVHGSLGWLAGTQDRPAESLGHCLRALDEYRAADHRAGQALILNDVGYAYALLGNYRQALTYCKQALAATQELGARSWEVAVWDSQGYIYHRLGDYERAISCYERSIALGRELADRTSQAEALEHLGDVYRSAGDAGAAYRAWTGSLRIFDEIGHPDGDAVRLKLHGSYGRRPGSVANGRAGEVPVN